MPRWSRSRINPDSMSAAVVSTSLTEAEASTMQRGAGSRRDSSRIWPSNVREFAKMSGASKR